MASPYVIIPGASAYDCVLPRSDGIGGSSMLKRAWEGWKRIARKIAHVQGHIILGLIYILVVSPLGILFRLFRQDPLALRRRNMTSFWIPRHPLPTPDEFLKK